MPSKPKTPKKKTIRNSSSVSREARKEAINATYKKGKIHQTSPQKFRLPEKGQVKRYLFTCAQNNTKMNMPVWNNLKVLAKHLQAEIFVSAFTYEKSKSIAASKESAEDWAPEIEPHMLNEQVQVAPGILFCGEMNIMPTAVRPLSSLDNYSGTNSGIFPHVKIAMESVPVSRGMDPKINYTTGTVTQRNYIPRKAGLKAGFHHCYGALLVEVDSQGDWFARQINAGDTGVLYDLDIKVTNGKISKNNKPAAILWGDVHVYQIDPKVKEACWGKGGILETLKPIQQHMGDVLDFYSRSHHDHNKPFTLFVKHATGGEDVRAEVMGVRKFLDYARRKGTKTVIISSNHHDHLGTWLEQTDARYDPINVEFWLAMSKRVYSSLRKTQGVNLLKEALAEVGHSTSKETYLEEDESHVICGQFGGGIECGMHGHLGPNGSRGTAISLSKTGRKGNVGHSHVAMILDGMYVAGTCSLLDLKYTRGPSSWSQSHVVTYANGKRAIITMKNGKWRATK